MMSSVAGITSPATSDVPQSRRKRTRTIEAKHQSHENCVADARDGIVDDRRLVVKGLKVNSRWKRWCKLPDLCVDFVGDLQCVAVWLPIHVQQDSRFAVCCDDRVDRRNRWRNRRNVAHAEWVRLPRNS